MKRALPPFPAFPLVVIGCSAGGIEALTTVLADLPAGGNSSIVVAIHLLQNPRSLLAELFRTRSRWPVKEAEDKESIAPGQVYFAPPGYHLLIERDRSFSLSVEDPVHFSRPSIDILFESAAISVGPKVLGILLTGANQDGAAGLKAIHDRGGYAIVQNPSEAAHSTMPQSALDLILPDAIWSLTEIRRYLAGERNG